MLAQLNLTVWAWIESFKGLGFGRLWKPFLLLAAVQVALVGLLTQFYRPALSWILSPLLEKVAGIPALHYPQFYIVLPGVFGRANLLIDWLLGSFCIGVALLIVYSNATGDGEEEVWRVPAKRYLSLLILRLPVLLLLYLINQFVPGLVVGDGAPSGMQIRMINYGTFALGVFVELLFVFGPVVLLVESKSIGSAFLEGFRYVFRVPIAAVLIIMMPNLIQLPIHWVFRRGDHIVSNLAPELTAWLVIAAIFLYVLINLLIVGSVVRVYGARREGA